MKKWPLRTTSPNRIDLLISEVNDPNHPRRFLWVHYGNKNARSKDVLKCTQERLVVLSGVPIWFIVACHRDVSVRDRLRMCKSIQRSQEQHEVEWRGQQFGYPEDDINWYLDGVKESKLAIESLEFELLNELVQTANDNGAIQD